MEEILLVFFHTFLFILYLINIFFKIKSKWSYLRASGKKECSAYPIDEIHFFLDDLVYFYSRCIALYAMGANVASTFTQFELQ